jgi:aminomuconate-semialdehyde/2-hydroxymuconate-6-semialdehyde dehydrogenase
LRLDGRCFVPFNVLGLRSSHLDCRSFELLSLLGPRSSHLDGRCFVRPAVITGLPPGARASCEEIFGPVLAVHLFEGEAELLAAVNGTRYGLAASLWTSDLSRAHRLARGIEVGLVWVNCWMQRDLRMPFGGVKDSGVGREGGSHSLEFYSEWKNVTIAIDGTPPPPPTTVTA